VWGQGHYGVIRKLHPRRAATRGVRLGRLRSYERRGSARQTGLRPCVRSPSFSGHCELHARCGPHPLRVHARSVVWLPRCCPNRACTATPPMRPSAWWHDDSRPTRGLTLDDDLHTRAPLTTCRGATQPPCGRSPVWRADPRRSYERSLPGRTPRVAARLGWSFLITP
jgi:hypothetical protein